MSRKIPESVFRLRMAGFSSDDAWALRRCSMTLHRWFERECIGEIEEDEDGRAWGLYMHGERLYMHGERRYRIPNRRAGAERTIKAIMFRYPTMRAYIQTDPRGCSLYILREGDVPEGGRDREYYSRGIPVFK